MFAHVLIVEVKVSREPGLGAGGIWGRAGQGRGGEGRVKRFKESQQRNARRIVNADRTERNERKLAGKSSECLADGECRRRGVFTITAVRTRNDRVLRDRRTPILVG